MRKWLIALLGTSSLLLASCGSMKNSSAFYSVMNYDKKPIEIKAPTLVYMIKEKYSFPVLMYTNSCSYCEQAKDNLSIVALSKIALYQIEMYDSSINYLVNNFPALFSQDDTYPTLMIFSRGTLSYKSNIDDVTKHTKLSKLINAYTYSSNITTLNDVDSYKKYQKNNDEYLLYTYSSLESNSQNLYSNYLYDTASRSKKKTLILDKMTVEGKLMLQIYNEYGITNDDDFALLSVVSNGKIKTTLHYLEESGQNITDLLTTFFDVDSIDGSR